VHRTRAKVKTVVLMIEAATVTPTGDWGRPRAAGHIEGGGDSPTGRNDT